MSEIKVNFGRKITLENAVRIGHGYYSEVYRIDPETVVKVLKEGTLADAEREIQLSKWALLNGIPTAISYDVADVEGHPGLVYELLGRGSLRDRILDHPEDFDRRMRQYAALLHSIHAAADTDGRLPKAADRYRARLDGLTCFTENERRRMHGLFDTLPETSHIVHCDCHFKNIKVVNDELMLIDLDTLSRGDPIFDFACMYSSYKGFSEARHLTEIDKFFDVPVETEEKILFTVIRYYFEGLDEATLESNIEKIALLSYYDVVLFALTATTGTYYDVPGMLDVFRSLLWKVDDLRLVYK